MCNNIKYTGRMDCEGYEVAVGSILDYNDSYSLSIVGVVVEIKGNYYLRYYSGEIDDLDEVLKLGYIVVDHISEPNNVLERALEYEIEKDKEEEYL